MGALGGDSPGRRKNAGKDMHPGRPAEAKAKKGKVPKGVDGHALGGGSKRKAGGTGSSKKKWWQF